MSQYAVKHSTKSQVITKLTENNLLHEVNVIQVLQGHYSWSVELAKIISKDDYYNIGYRAVSGYKRGKSIEVRNIEVLADLLLILEDADISADKRSQILKKITIYAREHGITHYSDASNIFFHPVAFWLKEIRSIYSKQENHFYNWADLGKKMLGYSVAIHDSRLKNFGAEAIVNCLDFCRENIRNPDDLRYIEDLIQILVSYRGFDSPMDSNFEKNFLKISKSRSSPKSTEILIIQEIRLALSETNLWNGKLPTIGEMTDFFGFNFFRIWSEGSKKTYKRVFKVDEISTIISKLKIYYASKNPSASKVLIDKLKNYNRIARVHEIETLFGSYDDWILKRDKKKYGDSSTKHPSKWSTKQFQKTIREHLFLRQGGYVTVESGQNIYHVFDGMTGELITWKTLTLAPIIDSQGNIVMMVKNEQNVEIGVIHHIDFNKLNNRLENFVWIKRKNHITNPGAKLAREYISCGKSASLAFEYGRAPNFWSLAVQLQFRNILKNRVALPLPGDTVMIQVDKTTQVLLNNFLGNN